MTEDQKKKILFLHIRKTAGTSARVALKKLFQLEEECPIRSQMELNGKVQKGKQADYLRKFDFIAGHFNRVAPIAGPDFKTVVFLRDPIDRVISAYNHINNDTTDPLHRLAAGKSLLECLDMPELASEFDNSQTRYLVGNAGFSYDDLSDEERCRIAIDYLLKIDFIGLTDFFDLSLALIARSIGMHPLQKPPKVNQEMTAGGPKRLDMIEQHPAILKRNMLDATVIAQARIEFTVRAVGQLTNSKVLSAHSPLGTPAHFDDAYAALQGLNVSAGGKSVLSLSLAETSIQSCPDVARYHYRHSEALEQIGSSEEALKAAKCAFDSNPQEPMFRSHYLRGLIANGDFDAAQAIIAVHLPSLSIENVSEFTRAGFLGNAPEGFLKTLLPWADITSTPDVLQSPKEIQVKKEAQAQKISIGLPQSFFHAHILWRRIVIMGEFFERLLAPEFADQTTQFNLDLSDGVAGNSEAICFCAAGSKTVLIPDPTFIRTRGYADLKAQSEAHDLPFIERKGQAYWRGAVTGQVEEALSSEDSLRNVLATSRIQFCADSSAFSEINAKITSLGNYSSDKKLQKTLAKMNVWGDREPIEQNFNYKYLIDIDGNTSSWPGLISKLICGGVVIKLVGDTKYRQWYYDELVHGENIYFASNVAEVREIVVQLQKNPDKAAQVAAAAKKLAFSLDFEKALSDAVFRIFSTN
ncbi:MAG: glycosyl transferase family 90 [Sulfitobacter sp.]